MSIFLLYLIGNVFIYENKNSYSVSTEGRCIHTFLCRMLQEDPVLFQLYKDLVVSQVISAEEFWANRMSTNNTENSSNKKQDVGISAAFLVS